MKTPAQQKGEREESLVKDAEAKVAEYERHLKMCLELQEKGLNSYSWDPQYELSFNYENEGEPCDLGKYNAFGKWEKTGEYKDDISIIRKIFEDLGWKVRKNPDKERQTGDPDYAGFEFPLSTGCLIIRLPVDTEPSFMLKSGTLMTPSQYLTALTSKLDVERVKSNIDRICDEELRDKREFEIPLSLHWKIRMHLLIPYVRSSGWVVEEHSDKIVIKYPEEPVSQV